MILTSLPLQKSTTSGFASSWAILLNAEQQLPPCWYRWYRTTGNSLIIYCKTIKHSWRGPSQNSLYIAFGNLFLKTKFLGPVCKEEGVHTHLKDWDCKLLQYGNFKPEAGELQHVIGILGFLNWYWIVISIWTANVQLPLSSPTSYHGVLGAFVL